MADHLRARGAPPLVDATSAGTEHEMKYRLALYSVLRDLLNAAIAEGLVQVRPMLTPQGCDAASTGEEWCAVGRLRARFKRTNTNGWRSTGGPVQHVSGDLVTPQQAIDALGLSGPGLARFTADLVTAVAHAEVLAINVDQRHDTSNLESLIAGERLAATRGRPFHPTARATSGWTAAEVQEYGPMRPRPLNLSWLAVRRDQLHLGPDAGSSKLHLSILNAHECEILAERMLQSGLNEQDYQPIPVHPWQAKNTLPSIFEKQFSTQQIVSLTPNLGRFHPTSSLRSLIVADTPSQHVKLPLAIATLGATRAMPLRNQLNSDRCEKTMRAVVGANPFLRRFVELCAEGSWANWQPGSPDRHTPAADTDGHIAAQIRTFPPTEVDTAILPMGAFASHNWNTLNKAFTISDPLTWFSALSDLFCYMVITFLSHGIFPELHGQNTLVRVSNSGDIVGFLLRDYDTLRVHPSWMALAGVEDPQHILRVTGQRQSLRLGSAEELISYAQTLAIQINLYGISDSLGTHYGIEDGKLWSCVRRSVQKALSNIDMPADMNRLLTERLLHAPRWPSRTILGPLLESSQPRTTSMPAGVGSVPNPLRGRRSKW